MMRKRLRAIAAISLALIAAMAVLPALAHAAAPYFVREWGESGSGNGQFDGSHNVAVDSSGNVYVCDLDNSRIQKFDSEGDFVLAFGSYGTANGQFKSPRGVSCDSAGNVFVADMSNNRVQKFTSAGVFVMAFGTSGTTSARLSMPHSVAFDSSGNIYVSDLGNDRIAKFNSAGVYQSQFGTSGSGRLDAPRDIAADDSGNFWVCDGDNYRVVEFSSAGAYLRAFGSEGTTAGRFKEPHGIAVHTNGNIYVSDAVNDNISAFSPTGTYLYRWGSTGTTQSKFQSPTGLASDDDGLIYAADEQNDRVQVFGIDATAPYTTSDAPIVWKNESFDVTLSAEDTESGIDYTEYRIDGGGWQTYTEPISVTVDGVYLLEFRSVDNAGNVEEIRSAYLKLDTTAPDVALLGFTDGGFYNTDIEPDAESTDPSAVVTMTVDGAPFTPGDTVSEEGTYHVVVTATDPAGNQSEASGDFTIDKTAPEGTMSLDDDAEYTRDAVVSLDSGVTGADTMSFDVQDGSGFGVSDSYTGARDVTLPAGDGTKTVVARYYDKAGNEVELSDTIVLDTTAPEISVTQVSDGTTYNTSVTPEIGSDDPEATLVITLDGHPYTPGTAITTEGVHVLVIVATDPAGNESTLTITFEIDLTAPTITVTGVVDEAYYASDVTPRATCDDPDAELSATLNGAPFILGTPVTAEGVYRLVVTAVDDHGNEATTVVDFTIDRTAPAVSIAGVADGASYTATVYPSGSSPDPQAKVTMVLDGAPFVSGSAFASEGSHVAVATAVDKAGNSASATVRFSMSLVTVDSIGNKSGQVAAAARSSWAFPNAGTVIIARDDDGADALIGAGLARVYNAPLLLTGKSSLSSSTRAEIKRLGAKRVFVLGGKLAITPKVTSSLKSMGVSVTRIGGDNRYETSALVAKRIQKAEGKRFSKKVIVVNGGKYADALAVVPLAHELKAPIVMTRAGSAPKAVTSYMKSVKWTTVVVAGPKSSVSVKQAKKLASRTKGTYTRLSGKTRYETAAAVDRYLTRIDPTRSNVVGVVWGYDWRSAVTGGVAVARRGGLMAAVAGTSLTQPTSTYLATRAGTVRSVVGMNNGAKPSAALLDQVRKAVTP